MEIFGIKPATEQLMAIMYAPGQETHLQVVLEKLPEDNKEAQKAIKEKLNSPAISYDIKFIWELNEECIIYYAHRVGNVLILSVSDYDKVRDLSSRSIR